MNLPLPNTPVRLFYSYCHEDREHRQQMEITLELLRREGVIEGWYDHLIVPGESISAEVRTHLEQSDIVAFLFSRSFIASTGCIEEWEYAKELETQGQGISRIPIIIRQCAWLDLLGSDDVKALPVDGKPVATYQDHDQAWNEVYEGIKMAIDKVRRTFSPRPEFIKDIEKTEFFSHSDIKLQDLYTFLTLTRHDIGSDLILRSADITDPIDILTVDRALIHGQEKTGKTALSRYLYLSLVDAAKPVLLLDLSQVVGNNPERRLRDAYREQFNGDYTLWKQKQDKTLILEAISLLGNHQECC